MLGALAGWQEAPARQHVLPQRCPGTRRRSLRWTGQCAAPPSPAAAGARAASEQAGPTSRGARAGARREGTCSPAPGRGGADPVPPAAELVAAPGRAPAPRGGAPRPATEAAQRVGQGGAVVDEGAAPPSPQKRAGLPQTRGAPGLDCTAVWTTPSPRPTCERSGAERHDDKQQRPTQVALSSGLWGGGLYTAVARSARAHWLPTPQPALLHAGTSSSPPHRPQRQKPARELPRPARPAPPTPPAGAPSPHALRGAGRSAGGCRSVGRSVCVGAGAAVRRGLHSSASRAGASRTDMQTRLKR